LSRENYAKAWAAQLKTSWGRQHLDRVALVDGPHVISSAKRYDLSLRIDGRIRRVLGIGAVFTATAHRGRGSARELLTRMLDTAVTEGQEFAMLFSEIAPAFYEQLDFVPVPLIESTLEVDQKRGGAPAMLVRSGDEKDLPAIVEMSAARSADARLAVDRSEDLIRFMISRKRIHSGFAPSGYRNTEFLVVEEGYKAVAYLVSTEQDGRCTIEEAGDRDPSGARLGAMLQVMLARSPGERLPEIKCWWPRALVPPQVKVVAATPTQEVLMIRPLRDRILPLPPLTAAEVIYWHSDYF
jgi:GNAT superfamily N-acetyltransferase